MPDTDNHNLSAHLQRNLRLYLWYSATYNTFFWLPVFFLFFSSHLTLDQVLKLEAIYYISVVALEVPSGYFSDVIGRKPTLLISSLAFLVACILFFFGSSFGMFIVAQVFLAAGISFNSGTDVSFHYDTLKALKRESEFAAREAIVARNGFYAAALGALLGGAIACFELRHAYGLSALAAIVTFTIVLFLREPPSHERLVLSGEGFFHQLRDCVGYLRSGPMRWLFGFAVLMTVLNHVPYEFYQPYLELLGRDLSLSVRSTPLVAGVATCLTMLIAGWGAGRSIRIRDRIGIGPTLLLATLLQTLIIGIMGLLLHPVIIALILLRSMPRALMAAPFNAAIAPLLSQQHRATYLSLQSLVGRLSFSGVLLMLAGIAGEGSTVHWEHISLMLKVSAILGIVGFVLLATTLSVMKEQREKPPPD